MYGWLIVLTPLTLSVALPILGKIYEKRKLRKRINRGQCAPEWFVALVAIAWTATLIVFALGGFVRLNNKANCQKMLGTYKTINGAFTRQLTDLDRAMLIGPIIDFNSRLMKAKFCNARWDPFVPDEVDELLYIRIAPEKK